jgi:phosphoribosylanthranilate isomerase
MPLHYNQCGSFALQYEFTNQKHFRSWMIIQIYAFTDPKEARAAALLGVDQIGFVAGDYGLVPAELSFAQARALMESLPENALGSALTMSTEVDEILRMAEAVRPHIIHISTDMEAVDLSKMQELKRRLPSQIRLMKAISVTDENTLEAARHFAAASDLLLLDTKSTEVAGIGVSGRTHDWNISRQIVESVPVPVILAGGLSAENIAEAIEKVKPWGVDSNSHTNRAGDLVIKDLNRIAAFVKAVREHENAGRS